ncbi:MAG: cysteine desulfurase family protein [bacterium]|nr:cysteine desulfurase family protein [bacterium]
MHTKRSIYLDHAATTPTDPRVVASMAPYFTEEYGNPSSLYTTGRRAKQALDDARARISRVFACTPEELIFTASGTESDNMAVLGIARAHATRGKHLITTAIEHHAVLSAVAHLAKREGFDTTILPVDAYGMVTPEQVASALREDTTLVSIMLANNEIGTIEPIAKIAHAIRQWKEQHGRTRADAPFFHTDACQASGFLDLDVQKLGVDLMTVNGSKCYGPKGIGVLYKRRGVRIEPLVFGGGQEQRMRSGTENVPGAIGLATALEIATGDREAESTRLTTLRDWFISEVQQRVPKVVLNGHPTDRLPNNVNVSILDIEGEAALLYLDAKGIAAATGSACDSQTLDPSHVILAIGRPYEYAHASIRFTFGRATTREELAEVLDELPAIVKRLREISPVRLEMDAKKTVGSGASRETAQALVGQRPHWESK